MADQTEKQADLAKHWEIELAQGLKYKSKYARPKDWERYKAYYRGDWKKDVLPVNRIFSYGRSMIPRTYFRNPNVSITPLRPELEWHARIMERVDNQLIVETGLKEQLKRAILKAYLCGTGPLEIGYDSEFGFNPEQALDINATTATQVDMKEGNLIEYNINIKPGMPWAISFDPNDLITPWGYGTADTMPWLARTVLRSLEDVKGDQKYRNTKDLKGGYAHAYGARNPFAPMSLATENRDLALLYLIRDRKRKKLITICEGQILMEQDDALQIEGLPFEFIIFNEDPDHFWGISDVRMLEPQQLELNEVRKQASQHRRRALLKFLFLKGALTQEAIDSLLGEHIGPGIEVRGDSIDTAIKTLQPHIPQDLWGEAREILGDFRETAGFSRNQAGEFERGTPPTATETRMVGSSSEIRSDERRDVVADAMTNIIRKWNQYIIKYWTKERVVDIVGPDGALHWIKYTGAQLKGEYFLRIDPEAGIPISREFKYRQAKDIFTAFRMDPLVDQVKLRQIFLSQSNWIDPTWNLILKQPVQQPMAPDFPGFGGGNTGEGGSPIVPIKAGKGSPGQPVELEEAMRG